jgi:hypothetical protein
VDIAAYFHQTSMSDALNHCDEQSSFQAILEASDDSSDASLIPWISGECTIDEKTVDDVTVPMTSSKVSRRYSLSIGERKLRKKDQNKSAAEKYRLKKRAERDELLQRQAQLKNANQDLRLELESLKFRLDQFKQLCVDVLEIPLPSK